MKKVKQSKSFILNKLNGFSELFFKKVKSSFIYTLLTGSGKNTSGGFFAFLRNRAKLSKRIFIPFKRACAKAFDKSIILNKIKEFISYLPY